ncbi:hypothetical protein WR25_21048 [Diploscapter pachys]|uniref:PIPK domain-containing protein n=1 Tax=Diploscapter pachys TaxID=2018661 RepID=A0A2A2KRY7_9BILA|nr:hypothetical protein WR25_21048 [Diploscapter pachys]
MSTSTQGGGGGTVTVNFKSVANGSGGGIDGDVTNREERSEKQKLGHRRIDEQGGVSYKKVPTNALMSAIQLGIANSIGSLASKPTRDLLLQDFETIESVVFPAAGSATTPSHSFGDFRFRAYAPIAFRYFRDLFHIKPADFLRSICTEPLRELSNAGASGSIFYVSQDDQFIIKTVQHKEAEFLQKLLPGYYMNLNQNPRTLLPKFFGLFCYQSLGKNIRLLVMNNLLPQAIQMHEKYDLKGSTYKRMASKQERAKSHPTLKDLDFLENHQDGITIDPSAHEALIGVLRRDCLVLQSFKIMDYSLLVGIHNLELAASNRRARIESDPEEPAFDTQQPCSSRDAADQSAQPTTKSHKALREKFSVWESVDANDVASHGGVPARNSNGDRLILYLGIIDILQNYRLLKKMEHTWKSILHDGSTISVHNPEFYSKRFMDFMTEHVFKKGAALKQSPSRRRTRKSLGEEDAGTQQQMLTKDQGQVGVQSGQSGGSNSGNPVSARDVVPILPNSSGITRVPLRKSYRAETITEGPKKEKKQPAPQYIILSRHSSISYRAYERVGPSRNVERLFASSSAKPEEKEPLNETSPGQVTVLQRDDGAEIVSP